MISVLNLRFPARLPSELTVSICESVRDGLSRYVVATAFPLVVCDRDAFR